MSFASCSRPRISHRRLRGVRVGLRLCVHRRRRGEVAPGASLGVRSMQITRTMIRKNLEAKVRADGRRKRACPQTVRQAGGRPQKASRRRRGARSRRRPGSRTPRRATPSKSWRNVKPQAAQNEARRCRPRALRRCSRRFPSNATDARRVAGAAVPFDAKVPTQPLDGESVVTQRHLSRRNIDDNA